MALNFIVNYSTSSTGPWTSAGTVASTTDVITGLQANTSYFVQIITVDTVSGLQASPVVSGPFTTASAESPSGTVILVTPGVASASLLASSTPGVAGSQNTILVTSGGQISVNGTVLTATGGVKELYYINHTCYQFNGIDWFGAVTATNGGTLGIVPDPRPTITGITLSNNTTPVGPVNGTVVGAISVVANSFTFAGTITIGGQDAGSFKIVGSNLACASSLTTGLRSITLTATQTGTVNGATVAPFTTASMSIGIGVPALQAPDQARLAGYVTPVVNEDFTTQSIAPIGGVHGLDPNGNPWNWWSNNNRIGKFNVDSSTDPLVDMYILNGQLIMKIDNGNGDCAGIQSSPGDQNQGNSQAIGSTPTSRPGATVAANQFGRLFTYGYFEINMKFDPFFNRGANPYPGFWMGQCYTGGLGAVSPGGQQPIHCEIDIMEVNGSTTDINNSTSSSLWQWGLAGNNGLNSGSPGNATVSATLDYTQFITYGVLWTPTTITFYRNNVAVSQPNAGHPSPITLSPTFSGSIDDPNSTVRPSMIINFGTGRGTPWPNVVDWVRVWQ